jgi:hypothetical protein
MCCWWLSHRVGVAIYSHFGPGKFPANWWTVFSCVVIYCVINLVLTIFGHIKEGSSFLITHPKLVSRSKGVVCLSVCGWGGRHTRKGWAGVWHAAGQAIWALPKKDSS